MNDNKAEGSERGKIFRKNKMIIPVAIKLWTFYGVINVGKTN
ncbi:hypothetical protein [Pedobacter miscanthi]|nr:hypothetical protein [Pedobacter miscanthi]